MSSFARAPDRRRCEASHAAHPPARSAGFLNASAARAHLQRRATRPPACTATPRDPPRAPESQAVLSPVWGDADEAAEVAEAADIAQMREVAERVIAIYKVVVAQNKPFTPRKIPIGARDASARDARRIHAARHSGARSTESRPATPPPAAAAPPATAAAVPLPREEPPKRRAVAGPVAPRGCAFVPDVCAAPLPVHLAPVPVPSKRAAQPAARSGASEEQAAPAEDVTAWALERTDLHPGVHGSTRVAAVTGPDGLSATVTVQATVSVTPCSPGAMGDDGCVVAFSGPDDGAFGSEHADVAMAFAVASATEAATKLQKSTMQRVWSPHVALPDVKVQPSDRHAPLLDALALGHVVEVASHDFSQFAHESFILELQHPGTGQRVRAIFKPRVEGDFDGWHRTPMERVAYQIGRALGFDLVPPTVFRRDLSIFGRTFPLGGALMFFVNGTRALEHVPQREWGLPARNLLSDVRILDVLLSNPDRHAGHIVFGDHWVRRRPTPFLIDHAASFRPGTCVCMHDDDAFKMGPITQVRGETYLRLKLMDAAALSGVLNDEGLLTPNEVADLMHRRQGVLRYLDGLVMKNGFENVVLP